MFLNQLSIAKRLACVLGLILSLSLLTSLFAVFKLQQMGEVTDAMLAVNLKTERATADWLRNTTAGEVMYPSPRRIAPDALAADAAAMMEEHRITSVLVTDAEQHLVGIVHIGDLMRAKVI